jgi:hypothetical protein
VGGLGVENESIARCSAIMCRFENPILLSNRIEPEVLLKFLEKILIFIIIIIIIINPASTDLG